MISPKTLFSFLSLLFCLLRTRALTFHSPNSFSGSRTRSNVVLKMAATTVERTQDKTSGPAVLDRPSTKKNRSPAKEGRQQGGGTWEVRIYNDGDNTREHVARSLVQITGMAEMTAYQTMMTAHQNGIASVGLFAFEIAEVYNEGLRHQGIVSDIIPVDEDWQ